MAFTALTVAGGVVVLYLGALFPVMHLSFAALTALFVAVSVIEGGRRYGVLCFVATALLGFLIVPDRIGVILFASFFGFYPLIKSIAEQQKSQILGWAIKFAVFALVWSGYILLWREVFLGVIPFGDQALALIYLGGAAAFLVYDIGMSKLIGFYLARIYSRTTWK
ncbi:MAG: hypothetical protein FWE28_04090 [Oscillospiraceae bacterium]|nr:hypothetical protein [Oscillospiraceae bacterium]